MSKPVIEVQSDSITIDKLTKDVRRQGFSQIVQTYNFDVSNPTRPITPERVFFVHPSFAGFTNPYFATIQSALDAVTDGDGFNIIVYGATYNENLVVSQNNITITTSGYVRLNANLTATGTHGILVDANSFVLYGNLEMVETSDGFDGVRFTANASYSFLEFHNITITDGNGISNVNQLELNVVCHQLSSIYGTDMDLNLHAFYACSEIEMVNGSTFKINAMRIAKATVNNCSNLLRNEINANFGSGSGVWGVFTDSQLTIRNLNYTINSSNPIMQIVGSRVQLIACYLETTNSRGIELNNTTNIARVILRNCWIKANTFSIESIAPTPAAEIDYLNQSTIKPGTNYVTEINTANKLIGA